MTLNELDWEKGKKVEIAVGRWVHEALGEIPDWDC